MFCINNCKNQIYRRLKSKFHLTHVIRIIIFYMNLDGNKISITYTSTKSKFDTRLQVFSLKPSYQYNVNLHQLLQHLIMEIL
jgi:hypothetical protein